MDQKSDEPNLKKMKSSAGSKETQPSDFFTHVETVCNANNDIQTHAGQLEQDIHSLQAGMWAPNAVPDLPELMLGNIKAIQEESAIINASLRSFAQEYGISIDIAAKSEFGTACGSDGKL